MKLGFGIVIASLLLISCRPESEQQTAASPSPDVAISATPTALAWKLPDPASADATVRYGQELVARTAHYLGPDQADPALRYGGNRLNCKSCHLQAGQQPHSLGFVGITARFPQYRGRENRQISLAERVNGCFERSLAGRALPLESREMQAIVAYMQWLSQDYPAGSKVEGQGLPEIELPERAADPIKGKQVFVQHCASCHQPGGLGLAAVPRSEGYAFPPLWGPDSFNTGAGMHRLITAARYIKANMPLGQPVLSAEQAFDVAAYINSQPRPVKASLELDFPDRSRKPVDAPFPPWDDKFSAQQHKYGPFKPMLAARQGQSKP
ncbi:MAG: hypothetical protein CVV27_06730 [Candidatus Melainabacteria bacterium HGW-Melainabacteria-1]|nr:MAG: hypothetical protein CVV27_06730 [Candidatus Melainabacteria bacterium HGW-Melainabacteria-1]